MRWPLRHQVVLPMVVILLLTIGVVSVLNAALASIRVRKQMETQLLELADTLRSTNFPLESNVLKQTRGLTGAEYVVVDRRGHLQAASDNALRPLAEEAGAEPQPLDLAQPVIAGERRYLHAAVRIDRRAVGGDEVTLHVYYPEAAWREARWQAVWPPLAIGGAAVVLVTLAAYLLAAHLTQPIERLRVQVGRIGEGAFSPVPLPSRDDEIRDLAVAVNRMAEQLARYEGKTRQSERLRTLGTLGGGIAHQIRNAATGCRIALDLHERDCPLNESSGNGGPLTVAARQLGQIETYIQRFLTLGRPSAIEPVAVELADVVDEAVQLVRPTAVHLGVGIEWMRPPQATIVRADFPALVQLVSNLLVNAVEATAHTRVRAGESGRAAVAVSADQAIVVRLSHEDGVVRLVVGDSGPGPSAAIQPRLFEPFETDKPGGTGLGLIVARQIADDHGGTIRWERRDELTWFIVTLPAL
jgi:signal transduction histidine kinase